MTFAFFYLVVGDLIIIHQKAIFDFDVFADHPMAKPDKSSKSKIYHLKDKKDRVLVNLITFISQIESCDLPKVSEFSINVFQDLNSFKLVDCKYSPISFRGPPAEA
jgi:hypothetical protein